MYLDKSNGCNDGRFAYFENEHEHAVSLYLGCNKRFECFCSCCADKWRRKTRARYADAIRHFERPKFLTLTLSKARGKEENLTRLWSMRKALFRKLRDGGHDIRGWVGVIEPPNHIHMVVDSDYLPHYEISSVWHTLTGDSYIVDIRKLKNSGYSYRKAIAYISKYITKISNWDGINLDFLKGFHIINSNGLVKTEKPIMACPLCDVLSPWHWISEEEFYAKGYDRLQDEDWKDT